MTPRSLAVAISLGNVPDVVVGILTSDFDTEQFDPQPDVWVPFQLDAHRVDGGKSLHGYWPAGAGDNAHRGERPTGGRCRCVPS